jgi:hypothetical protein
MHVSEHVMDIYRVGRWDVLVAPNFCLDEEATRRAPRVLRWPPTPPEAHAAASVSTDNTPFDEQDQSSFPPPPKPNKEHTTRESKLEHSLRRAEAVKLLRAFSPENETFTVAEAEALWGWADDTRYRSDLLQRALAGQVQLSIDGADVSVKNRPAGGIA